MLTIEPQTFAPSDVITQTVLDSVKKKEPQVESQDIVFSIGVEQNGQYFPIDVHLSVIELEGATKILLTSDTVVSPARIEAGAPNFVVSPAVQVDRRFVIEISNESLVKPGTTEIRI